MVSSDQTWQIRRATPADAPAIAAAHRDSILALGPAFYPPQAVDDWQAGVDDALYLNAMARGEVFFIAVAADPAVHRDDAVLGFASDHPIDGPAFGVSAYVRGGAARRGIGSALLAAAEADAIERGARVIQIEASLAGLGFYQARGFVETGRGDVILATGRTIACVFMRKLLRE